MSVAACAEAEHLSPLALDLLAILTRTLFGAEPAELSTLYLAAYVAQGNSVATLTGTADAAQASWVAEGAYQLPLRPARAGR